MSQFWKMKELKVEGRKDVYLISLFDFEIEIEGPKRLRNEKSRNQRNLNDGESW
jgi:hypothetical protein